MKIKPFPSGVHLVALEGNTSPIDFLAAFQYENRNLVYIDPSIMNGAENIGLLKKSTTIGQMKKKINMMHGGDDPKSKTPGSISILRKLDLTKDCCPIVLLPRPREDCGRLIDRLYELSTLYSSTIFVFFSEPLECINEAQQYFTTILTYDESTNGGTVKKGAGTMPIGPYTLDPLSNAIEKALNEPPSEDSANDEAPSPKPTENVTKISDLVKTRGFHQVNVSEINGNAILRGDKTDLICSASNNVQKGDWLVLSVDGIMGMFNPINEIVWEVSFVSNIPLDNGYGQVALSIRRLPNARFKKGDLSGPYRDDCIVFSNPPKKDPKQIPTRKA